MHPSRQQQALLLYLSHGQWMTTHDICQRFYDQHKVFWLDVRKRASECKKRGWIDTEPNPKSLRFAKYRITALGREAAYVNQEEAKHVMAEQLDATLKQLQLI